MKSMNDETGSLGETIRKQRKQQRLTLNELAALSGLSRAALSKIERGEISPTYQSLNKIAAGFDVSLMELIGQASAQPFKRADIVRAAEGMRFKTGAYSHKMLVDRPFGRPLRAFLSRVGAWDLGDFEQFDQHPTDDLIFVLEGAVRLYREGEASVDLAEGDAIFMDSVTPHALVSLAPEDTRGTATAEALVMWISLDKDE